MIDAAIVLAAGRGQRLGLPKALLQIGGQLLIAQHLARLAELGCGRTVVVVPASAESVVQPHCAGALVVAAETASPAHSLSAALQALEATSPLADDAVVLITPVDLLPPRLDTLLALARAMTAGGDAVAPQHRGRHGHPLLIRRARLSPYGEAGEPPPLDRLVSGLRRFIDVDDARVLGDIDEPKDRARAEADFAAGAQPSPPSSGASR